MTAPWISRPSLLLILLFLSVRLDAAEPVHIGSFLALGPYPSPLPAWNDLDNVSGQRFALSQLLSHPHLDTKDWWPADGQPVRLFGQITRFRTVIAASAVGSASDQSMVAWLAFYIETDRYDTVSIGLKSPALFDVTVNGTSLWRKTSADSNLQIRDIALLQGKHLVLVKTVHDPKSMLPWAFSGTVDAARHTPRVSVSASRHMDLGVLLDTPYASSVALNADGTLAAVTVTRLNESWIRVLRVTDGGLMRTFRGATSINGLQWAPDARRFLFVERNQGSATIWLVNLETGEQTAIARNIQRLGMTRWSRDGQRVYITQTEQPDTETSGFKKLEHPNDRWPQFRTRSHLSELRLDGTLRRLTWGPESVNLLDEHPSGTRLLVSRSRNIPLERPFSESEIGTLDLASLRYDSLFTTRNTGSMLYAPDGQRLLVSGSAAAFNGAGNPLPEGVIPNDYDTQLYLYTLASGVVAPITRDFNPNINQAQWSHDGAHIYVTAGEKAYVNAYRYELRRGTFTKLDTGVDITGNLSISRTGTQIAFVGNGVNLPPKAYVLDPVRNRSRIVDDPSTDVYRNVRYGDIQPWTFRNAEGTEIDGHVYYPVDFDASRKYPVIVYYYGGTNPVTRDFGGRYPKEVWAARGYVVYVLQPSGATGYGAAFAAAHVNNWGITVADEIIQGTREFLAAHPFADADRVGAIGASYGGFMTMLLATRTDIFKTGISHAGISNITSYWGEGYWGWSYSSAATAGSYPWNRRDIYVDQSPIFFADKVTMPLLLLHGASDTNVPLGESWQFYTALRLLDKDVELIEVADQDHHIVNHPKRVKWSETILAWFDKQLKDQPEWWEAMY
jgi:dipeptidyl aminopeptidase/acylaminoacyl peptidase